MERQDDNAIDVAADFQGEGESWSANQRLKLGDRGDTLTLTGNGVEIVRIRCPAGAPAQPNRWESSASGEGDSLWLQNAAGRILTLSCPATERELIVNVPTFWSIAGEEQLSFGAGGLVVALIADPAEDPALGGVTARGAVPEELTDILVSDSGIALNYDAQNAGPFPAPSAEQAAALPSAPT